MAIDTYSSLKTAIADYLARSDLTSAIPTFISLFEARINNVMRNRGNEYVTTLTPDVDGKVLLPADYYTYRSVNAADDARELEYLTPSSADERYGSVNSTQPRAFTIIGDYLFVYPSSTTDIVLSYYRGVTPLTDLLQTNWMLTRHPGLYLYGSLSEAAAYIEEDAQIQKWEGKLSGLLEDLVSADRSARWGKARSQVPGGAPC